MSRIVFNVLMVCLCSILESAALAQPATPNTSITYEVMINGESFRVEGNRTVKVQSKDKPGTSYEIAVFVSPTQRLRLNSLRLEYEMPAKVSDDRGKAQRVVQIRHELGFTVTLTDLGQPLGEKGQEDALKALSDFVCGPAREQKAEDIEVAAPHERKFEGAQGHGAKIHYNDATKDGVKGAGHTVLAYVLTGAKFAATCVVEYPDKDSQDVLPLIKKILDSVQGLE